MKYIFLTLLAFFHFSVLAQDCDCTRVLNSCSASYEVSNIRNDPSRTNSAAEVILRSSAPRCSKVTFFVDSTPYISLLKKSNLATESIFGSGVITKDTIEIESCKVCAQGTPSTSNAGANLATEHFIAALNSADLDKAGEMNAVKVTGRSSPNEGPPDLMRMISDYRSSGPQAPTRIRPARDPNRLDFKGAKLPARCAGNPAAPGCPYHTGTYDPTVK